MGEGARIVEKVRNLPTLHFGPMPVFADRKLEAVHGALREYVDAALQAPRRALYQVRACEIEGAFGLYARDSYNRSWYRRALARNGVRFFGSPIIGFEPGRGFVADGREFRPAFSILGGATEDGGLLEHKGALVPFTVAMNRLGPIGAGELKALVRATSQMTSVGADDPVVAAEFLRSRLS